MTNEWKPPRPSVFRRRYVKRGLGYIPLNKPFQGGEGHHINMSEVIFIPKELHHSIYHNRKTRVGMVRMNQIAQKYLEQEMN